MNSPVFPSLDDIYCINHVLPEKIMGDGEDQCEMKIQDQGGGVKGGSILEPLRKFRVSYIWPDRHTQTKLPIKAANRRPEKKL